MSPAELTKTQVSGPHFRNYYLMDLSWRSADIYIYNNSHVMLMLLVQGPHFENHRTESIDTV